MRCWLGGPLVERSSEGAMAHLSQPAAARRGRRGKRVESHAVVGDRASLWQDPAMNESPTAELPTSARVLSKLGSWSRRLPPSRQKNRLGRVTAYLLGDPPAAQASVGGIRLWLRPADRTASGAFWSGKYEEESTELLTGLLEPGMTVVDAGANVGMIGLRLADRLRTLGAGRVLLVEPIPANMWLLKASLRSNHLEDYC